MKNEMKSVLCLAVASLGFSGCATVVKGTKSNVYFLNAPADLEVWNGSEKLQVETKEAKELYGMKDSFSDEMNSTTTTYQAPGVTLGSGKEQTLKLKSGSQEAEVKLKPRLSMNWLVIDIFTGGWLVDAFTGAWNELAPEGGKKNIVNVKDHLK
jgi:hypothetical protein